MRFKLVSSVFSKELIAISRHKRFFLVRGVFILALLAAMYFSWYNFVKEGENNAEHLIQLALLGEGLFKSFILILLATIFVLVPAMTSSIVAVEKDRNTLSLLLMSNLKPHNIILDKLLSRMLLLLYYILASAPLFICLLLYKGVEFAQIVEAFIILAAAILFFSGIGIITSTFMNKLHSALTVSYLVICLLLVISLIIFNFFYDAELSSVSKLSLIFPPFAIIKVIEPTKFVNVAEADVFTWYSLSSSVVIFILCLIISCLALPYQTTSKNRNLLQWLSKKLNDFFDFGGALGKGIISEGRLKKNPVIWREVHKNFFATNIIQIRCFYLVAIGLVLVFGVHFFSSKVNRTPFSKLGYNITLPGQEKKLDEVKVTTSEDEDDEEDEEEPVEEEVDHLSQLDKEQKKKPKRNKNRFLKLGTEDKEADLFLSYPAVWGTCYFFAVGLIGLLSSSAAFAKEKENHSFNTLRITTMKSHSIVLAKLLGILKTISVIGIVPPILAFSLHRLICGSPVQISLLLLMFIMMSTIVSIIISGMRISLKENRYMSAILKACGWAIAEVIVVWLMILFLHGAIDSSFKELFTLDNLGQKLNPLALLDTLSIKTLSIILATITAYWFIRLVLLVKIFEDQSSKRA